MWSALADAARLASEAPDFERAKVLWLLADACSIMLKPESPSEPLRPLAIVEGRRSALPEDFDEEALGFFAEALSEIDDARLRARLADLLWLRREPRRVEDALAAIDAYRSLPIDAHTWVHDGQECLDRAIQLCRMLGRGADQRRDAIRATLFASFSSASDADAHLALRISRMMREHRLGRDHAASIAEKLRLMATSFDEHGNLHGARDHFDEASLWYGISGDQQREASATVSVAETWVKESRIRTSGEHPSYMVGATLLESAIQAYRRVPRRFRAEHRVDQRIVEIHTQMTECGERGLDEMGTIKSPPIDLTEMVEEARRSVLGKSATEALRALSSVSNGAAVERDRAFAERTLRDHPLRRFFSATHMSRDGRVIARTGPGSSDQGSDEYEAAVWSQMVSHFRLEMELAVQRCILPAREVLISEHRLRERDFVSLARHSPIVPIGREELFGKALFFGFEGEFGAAIHILVPQIEHLVRVHLKTAGLKTTTLTQEGIEQEKGLSALMEGSAPEEIFGVDLAFEIRALLCDAIGPNLRNEIAHGLLGDAASQSIYACYAWWFGLRLIFTAFWNAAREQYAASQAQPATPEPASEES